MLSALLIVSYGLLLWLTIDEHRPAATGTVGARAPVQSTAAPEASGAEIQTHGVPADRIALLVANEPLPEEGISSGDEGESEVETAPKVMQLAASTQADALLRRASSPDAAIQALSQALEPGSDRETRLAAVNALLVIGRKSVVDPTVVAMLKAAVNDADSAVASQANSALAEVERQTH